ncbi:hypothetical protein [Marivirga sp.]|uniref:hypothetical protein n=1 Tax=Marivirga sp. TaxID=2018662 RepID=UPI0025DE0A75|nr:hypothetical protein [Marivirga sp.]
MLGVYSLSAISEIYKKPMIYCALAPIPCFFQFLKKAGLSIAAVGIAVITAPGAVTAILLAYAGHAVTGGTILVSIS